MEFALMVEDYGPFKKFKSYETKGEGDDWVLLHAKGKPYYVSKSLLHPDPFNFLLEEEENYDDQLETTTRYR